LLHFHCAAAAAWPPVNLTVSRNFFNSLLAPSFVQLFSGHSFVNLCAVYPFKYKLFIKILSLSLNSMLIYIDSDVSTRSHVTRTVSACFAVLRQLRSIRRSVPRSVFQSLVASLVLTRLDYGNSILAGVPQYQLKRLQSVMNAVARLVFSSSRYESITPLLRQLHWLKAAERIDYKLALLVYTSAVSE